MGWRVSVPLQPLADLVLPWLYLTFGIALASGMALFLYDPVHVGSHAYFSLKLLLTALGLANAALFRRSAYFATFAAAAPVSAKPSAHARVVGAVSLLLWTGVVVCACLNVEAAPKLLLR
jgi:hypothetical protein